MRPRHEAPGHQLPHTTGYSSGSDHGLSVYCGRCKGDFRPDPEWAERYFGKQAERAIADLDSQRQRVLGSIEEDKRRVLAALDGSKGDV